MARKTVSKQSTVIQDEILSDEQLYKTLLSVKKGDFSVRFPVGRTGIPGKFCDALNSVVEMNEQLVEEVVKVREMIGKRGKLTQRVEMPGARGGWYTCADSVNTLIGDLVQPTTHIAQVIRSVAKGDLSAEMPLVIEAHPLKGEFLRIAKDLNAMVKQLNMFSMEVTRVAREVGTEGKLGGQAKIKGVDGVWKDLTDSVNQMASNLTSQVRGIAKVVTAVAKGNLKQKLSIDAKGEVALLTDTINEMIDDTLAVFAEQVTTMAREVGAEGKLGGQANVPGGSGIWKDLTENVNQLAANLTTQVRAIADVASAVTKGDLSRTINVKAKGEVEALKDTINQMIANLKATTMRNQEQDWLKSNLAKLNQMLQGQKEPHSVARKILSELARIVSVQHGVFYQLDSSDGEPRLKLLGAYAYSEKRQLAPEYKLGEGLIGQCALEKERILLTNVPGDYIHIASSLGSLPPLSIMILPVLFEGQIKAVIELASFDAFSTTHVSFFEQLTESIGIVLNTIESNMRTEELLQQSQKLAGELKSQQEELRITNEELEEKAKLLVKQKEEVEGKNMEVEIAKKSLEEKAAQLTITSQYKSEFLANMSHELRTPLNSLLILSQQLSENKDGNLTDKQVSYSKTIHSCGVDLINLINDILDLSKIESGKVTIDVAPVLLHEIVEHIQITFGHMAEYKKLSFAIDLDASLPEHIETDVHKLRQILKNLLSNAFKFTAEGSIGFRIFPAEHELAMSAVRNSFIAFEISDTGIGIPQDKQHIIFEAFQQAEGSTSRKYGGTGLGLSISRGLANMLGGFIELESEVNEGSTFTLYLPAKRNAQRPQNTGTISVKNRNGSASVRQEPALVANYELDAEAASPVQAAEPTVVLADDRGNIQPHDTVVLVFEQEPKPAALFKQALNQREMKAIMTSNADEVLTLTKRYKPVAVAMNMDPGGWRTLNLLKNTLETRHIPVGIMAPDEEELFSYRRGSVAFTSKPASEADVAQLLSNLVDYQQPRDKKVLIIEDEEYEITQMQEYFQIPGVAVTYVTTGKEAMAAVDAQLYDCIVLDLILPDISGFDVFEHITQQPKYTHVPVLVYSAKDLIREEERKLGKYARFIAKSVSSVEQLFDQVVLCLHIPHDVLPDDKKRVIENLKRSDTMLNHKKILIVDDDIRNIFALTSIFEKYDANIFSAEGGQEALNILNEHNDMTVVLMDIMMPEMDGYETMRRIRAKKEFSTLPIIAVTAKAMRGDREKCIEAGASDYIIKPIDTAELLSLLKLWL